MRKVFLGQCRNGCEGIDEEVLDYYSARAGARYNLYVSQLLDKERPFWR